MFYAIVWLSVAALLALWSGGLWAVDALATWSAAQAGTAGGLPALTLPGWLTPWISPELAASLTAALADLAPWFDGLVGLLPAIAGGVTVLLWLLWAFGALVLVGLGVALHLGIRALRHRARRSEAPARPRNFTAATNPAATDWPR